VVIDSHVHLGMSEGGLKPILDACDKLEVDKVCLLASYRDVKKARAEAPDRVIPLATVDLDREQSSFIHLLADNDIRGLKCTRPQHPYDHESYHGFYSTAEEYGLPILFHTGIRAGRSEKVINENMRPIHLDHLARTFPDLNMVMAHLGNPWWDEAAMAVRHNANLYFDLSGSSLKKRPPEHFRTLLWWDRPGHPYEGDGGKHPFDKLLYGTDVAPEWMEDVRNDHENLLEGMSVPPEYREKIMGLTAMELYGIDSG